MSPKWFHVRPRPVRVGLATLLLACSSGTGVIVGDQQIRTRPPAGDAVITVQASVNVGSPFHGWGGTAWLSHEPWDANAAAFSAWGSTAINRLVFELGITDIRLNLPPGVESDADYYQMAWTSNDKRIWTQNSWGARDTDRFFFTALDKRIQLIVGPMRALVQSNGEKLWFVLHNNGGGNGNPPDPRFYDSTADDIGNGKNGRQKTAARVLAAFRHMYERYGWIPDAVDPINEPDLKAPWTPAELADLVYRIGTTLENNRAQFGQGAGWRPTIYAPSVSKVSAFHTWFMPIWDYDPQGDGSYPNRRYVQAAAWHLYDSNRPDWNFGNLKPWLASTGLPGQMPEYTGLTASLAHEQLVDVPETNRLHRFSLFDWLSVSGTNVELSPVARLLRNYSYYVRPGAQRKGVSHNSAATFANGIPWVNPDGKYVVTVKTTGSGTFWVDQLPAGTYGINFGLGTDTDPSSPENTTNVTMWNQELPEVVLASGSALEVSSAGRGVYTIYQK